jgi:predicted unusual protein kinase regulating ubiquinone biosynthesis (AarF/ABC1/UbiB family)
MIAQRRKTRTRRDEVLATLAGGATQARRARSRSPARASARREEMSAERLARALVELGPIFAAYGLYLSSRGDILSRADRRVFAAIGRNPVPLSPPEIQAIVRIEFARASHLARQSAFVGDAFAALDDEPFDTRLLIQRHYGRLASGRRVVVRIVRPHTSCEGDLELLPLLRDAVAPLLSDGRLFSQSLDDFRASYEAQTNGLAFADALDFLRRDSRGLDSVQIPAIYREISTRRVLIVEHLPGPRLAALLALNDRRAAGGDESIEDHSDNENRGARRTCDLPARLVSETWFRQAFDGGMVSTEPRADDLIVLGRAQIAIDEGTFVSLPEQTRHSMLQYLLAVAVDEPRKALDCMLKEFESERSRTSVDELDRLFRQLVPGVDDDEPADGSAGRLASTVQMQWRLAIENGYRPLRHSLPLLRGFVCLNETIPGSPSRPDALLEGLKDYRLTRLLGDVHAMLEPLYWFSRIDRIADLVIASPRILDDALAAALPNRAADERRVARPRGRDTRSARWVVPTLVALVAIGFAYVRAPPVSGGPWGEALAAAAFLFVGCWMLRNAVDSAR